MFKVIVKSGLKGVVGASVAYVLAIQLILTAALSTQMIVASADAQSICHDVVGSRADDGHGTPAQSGDQNDNCRICLFAAAASVVHDAAPIPLVGVFSQTANPVVAWISTPAARPHEPRSSRGPPGIV